VVWVECLEADEFVEAVEPFGIGCLDEIDFPLAAPFLEPFSRAIASSMVGYSCAWTRRVAP